MTRGFRVKISVTKTVIYLFIIHIRLSRLGKTSVSGAKMSVMVQVGTTNQKKEGNKMISIGIDIAKEKLTVCALEQGSKIIWKPFDVNLKKTKVEEFFKKTRFVK